MVYGTDIENNHNNHNGIDQPQIFHRRSKAGDIPRQFITPGNTILEAITSSRLSSINQLNNIITLAHKAEKWGVNKAKIDVLIAINGLRAIDGRSTDGMLQASAQILVPDWGGPISKKAKKDVETVKRHRERGDDKQYKDEDVD